MIGPNTEIVQSWDDLGVADPLATLTVGTFDVAIDPTRAWWLHDEDKGEDFPIGQTDVFDGWTPLHANPPLLPTVTLRLPVWRTDTSMVLTGPSWSGEAFAPWEGLESSDTLAGVDGMAAYTIQTLTTTLPNPRPYEGGPLTLNIQNSAGGSIPVYAGDNDLRLWLPPSQQMPLMISASRAGHRLLVRHPNGDGYPIQEDATLGVYTTLSGGVSYYVFRPRPLTTPSYPGTSRIATPASGSAWCRCRWVSWRSMTSARWWASWMRVFPTPIPPAAP